MAQTMSRSTVTAIAPEQVTDICLADGWHQVSEVELTQFAVGISHSPPEPSKFYPALRYRDDKSGKTAITPLSQVQAFNGRNLESSVRQLT